MVLGKLIKLPGVDIKTYLCVCLETVSRDVVNREYHFNVLLVCLCNETFDILGTVFVEEGVSDLIPSISLPGVLHDGIRDLPLPLRGSS